MKYHVVGTIRLQLYFEIWCRINSTSYFYSLFGCFIVNYNQSLTLSLLN